MSGLASLAYLQATEGGVTELIVFFLWAAVFFGPMLLTSFTIGFFYELRSERGTYGELWDKWTSVTSEFVRRRLWGIDPTLDLRVFDLLNGIDYRASRADLCLAVFYGTTWGIALISYPEGDAWYMKLRIGAKLVLDLSKEKVDGNVRIVATFRLGYSTETATVINPRVGDCDVVGPDDERYVIVGCNRPCDAQDVITLAKHPQLETIVGMRKATLRRRGITDDAEVDRAMRLLPPILTEVLPASTEAQA